MIESGQSLTVRAVNGAAWVFGGKIVARLLTVGRWVVLARLLAPEDFGLFGIVMLAIATLDTFSQTGFDAALIQRKEDTAPFLDTAWTVKVVRGFFIAALLFAVAPAVGWIFADYRAVPLLRVMCVAVAIDGLANVGVIYFRKDLQFHKQVIYDLVGALVALVVGVVLAYRLRTVWAMVWAGLASSVAQSAASYLMHPYRPKLRFDRARATEMFSYGRWVLGASVLILLLRNGDNAFVGKVLGAAALGIYQMAYRISNLATTEITYTVSAVAMPAYSQMQGDVPRLRRWYIKVLSGCLLLATPLAAGTAAVAPMLVAVVFGPQWLPALAPVQILCIFGLLRAAQATAGPLFYGNGNPEILTRSTALEAVFMVGLIWPCTARWGVSGTCIAVTVAIFISLFYVSAKVAQVLQMKVRGLAACVMGGMLPGLAMFAVVSALAQIVAPGVLGLAVLVLVGVGGYAALLGLLLTPVGARLVPYGATTQETLRSVRDAALEVLARRRGARPAAVSAESDRKAA